MLTALCSDDVGVFTPGTGRGVICHDIDQTSYPVSCLRYPVLSLFACTSHLVMLSRVSIPHRHSGEGKCPTWICRYDSSNGQDYIGCVSI